MYEWAYGQLTNVSLTLILTLNITLIKKCIVKEWHKNLLWDTVQIQIVIIGSWFHQKYLDFPSPFFERFFKRLTHMFNTGVIWSPRDRELAYWFFGYKYLLVKARIRNVTLRRISSVLIPFFFALFRLVFLSIRFLVRVTFPNFPLLSRKLVYHSVHDVIDLKIHFFYPLQAMRRYFQYRILFIHTRDWIRTESEL